jgi:tetratricopeptide (TPR) repeat protein
MDTPLPPIRAFLSYSSLDKPYVEQVFADLGPTLAELDSVTFEPAKLNSTAILNALDRCAAFVLFASQNSLKSKWVATEIALALKRIKDNRFGRLIVYCLDRDAFKLLNDELRDRNVVRIEKKPLICAKQIRGILAEMFAERFRADTFVSRDENLAELKHLVIDPSKNIRTLAVSGFDRLGRRTLARRFCKDVYPAFNAPSQSVVVEISSSLDDIFRQLLGLQYKNLEQAILVNRLTTFASASPPEQTRLIGAEIISIYRQNEFVQFLDAGGLIADDGDLTEMFQTILAQNPEISDLIHILILHRNAPDRVKRRYGDIAFYRLPPLTDAQAEIAVSHELKKRKTNLPREQIVQLASTIDGHPANLDFLVGYIFQGNELEPIRLSEVLSGSAEYANWKRGRAALYVSNFRFSEIERLLIGLFSRYRSLAAESLARYMQENDVTLEALGTALGRLLDVNIIDVNGSEYRLIRPLRDALERDDRFQLTARQSDGFARSLIDDLNSYDSGDLVPIALIDSTTIAAIREEKVVSGWLHQLVLPSHYIWLARDSYHKRDYLSAWEFSQSAMKLSSAMTPAARLEALRFGGLSCARMGNDADFRSIIGQVEQMGSRRARGNKHFLVGFFSRKEGKLQTAHDELKKAFDILPGNIDVERELLSVLLARTSYDDALALAQNLVIRAENNPYVLDGYLQARIALAGNVDALTYDAEFSQRLDLLEKIGHGAGRSFFALRQVDLALKKRDKRGALEYSSQALRFTPTLPAAHAARTRALLFAGDLDKALGQVKELEQLPRKQPGGKKGLEFLALYQVRYEYNLQRGRYDLCKFDIENLGKFDKEQAKSMKRELAFRISREPRLKIDQELRRWLKA